MVRRKFARYVLLPAAVSTASVANAEDACLGIKPRHANEANAPRPISADDLIRLRDFGAPVSVFAPRERPFSVSPDGTRAALVLFRAAPSINAICVAVVVVPLFGVEGALLVDTSVLVGPRAFSDRYARRVRSQFPPGFAGSHVPQWSPDGAWLAFLKRDIGTSILWRARADGSRSEALTDATGDVMEFTWSSDGRSIIYASQRSPEAEQGEIDAEGRQGFLYDERVDPSDGPTPQIPTPPPQRFAIDTLTGEHRDATPEQVEALVEWNGEGRRRRSALIAASNRGDVAEIVSDPQFALAPTGLSVRRDRTGEELDCADERCNELVGVWWLDDDVLFVRREGWGQSQLAMYRWTPGGARPVRLFVTDDLLFGCEAMGRELLCAREASNSPRRLVLLEPASGRMRDAFDPNPETASWRFGGVQRLYWRSELGAESFGDLVLPPGHEPGTRVPLIVVGYRSRGFLRGGTGDEYPIQPFAARGYGVLVYDRPSIPERLIGARSFTEVNRRNRQGFVDRRYVHGALASGVQRLIDEGIADPRRIGLTGFSDGASTARWALIHSDLFAAASITSCCDSAVGTMALGGFRLAERWRSYGYPGLTDGQPEFWQPLSFELNLDSMRTPLLIQAASNEYLLAVPAVAARARTECAGRDVRVSRRRARQMAACASPRDLYAQSRLVRLLATRGTSQSYHRSGNV